MGAVILGPDDALNLRPAANRFAARAWTAPIEWANYCAGVELDVGTGYCRDIG
jgi:hypothetical protein